MDTNDHKFAYELAHTLGDTESLTVYQQFVLKYKEDFLRRILAKVMALPDHKIKRTRGALFTYLIRQHGHDNSRD